MDTEEIKRRAGITESKSEVKAYDVKVNVDGTVMWTRVFAENNERAAKIARKLFGKIVGRPSIAK